MRGTILLAAACCLMGSSLTRADDELPRPPKIKPNPTPSELQAILQVTIDPAEFAEETPLPDALKRLDRILARSGKSLPIRINFGAFKEEAPDAEDVRETNVRSPVQPRRPTVRQFLDAYASQIKGVPAAHFVGPGYVELTTEYHSKMIYRLSTPVTLNVRGRPLALVLDDLFEQTGVTIVVDARVAQRTRIPITATTADAMPLDKALYLLLNMADLRMVTVGNSVFVTSPQNAYQIYWERWYVEQFPFRPSGPQLASP